ncbi:MAG: PQQ-dependent sugar dehydrogenase [Chloroflexi bacterium]|nr:PQQ-dependent sugar dehydrogenase [Chloroflexota bacterium]
MRILISLVLTGTLLAGLASTALHQNARANANAVPDLTFTLSADGLTKPVHLTHAGDSSNRIFIVEQGGRIRFSENGGPLQLFLDIHTRVRSQETTGGTEEGLLSVAFPPGYGSSKDYFYVYYTNLAGDNQVSRFYLGANPDQADPANEHLVLTLPHPFQGNHNGGQLAFGPDGYLYIGTGDGGGGGDPYENAQNLASLQGKLLRIDTEMVSPPRAGLNHTIHLPLVSSSRTDVARQPYRIPANNPFIGAADARQEIWAYGLRNPWRFSFDRLTGDLYLGDVGQNNWEEVNFQAASSAGGENYGWDVMEGNACYEPASGCNQSGLTLPVITYSHDPECSITGGFVYRGPEAALLGYYFYADFCSGKVWAAQTGGAWVEEQAAATPYSAASFGEDQQGNVYIVDREGGAVYRLSEAVPPGPTPQP